MPKLKISSADMVAFARARIKEIETPDLIAMLDDPSVIVVDIRDIRELQRDGRIEGAFHAPRGMLEFWADPDSPYHKEIFATEGELVLFCASSWRSALAAKTLQDMGFSNIRDMEGGFTAWKTAGLPITKDD